MHRLWQPTTASDINHVPASFVACYLFDSLSLLVSQLVRLRRAVALCYAGRDA